MIKNNTSLVLIGSALVVALAWAGLTRPGPALEAPASDAAAVTTCAQIATSKAAFPPAPTRIDPTCATIPLDFSGAIEQANFDLFAWLSLVAVSWPVDPATCAADAGSSILTNPSRPVWLSYATDTSVFAPPGQSPAPWCPQSAAGAKADALSAHQAARIALLPEKVRALATAHPEASLYLSHSAKGAGLLHARQPAGAAALVPANGILQATGQPVVDQNGRFARYSVFMNKVERDYLVGNALWTNAGQAKIGAISFPSSDRKTGALGAMEFKAAWKVLGAKDDPSRFLTQIAIVYNDDDGAPSPGPNPVRVGLAGFHLTHKTQSSPEWIWATFSQVDNVTTSFFNPSCSGCAVNAPPTLVPYKELDAQGKPLNPPTQVVAVTPPESSAVAQNTAFQALLKGTPWAYYQLVSAQWTGEFGNQPKPPQLGNPVIETYVTPGNATYGCLQCHDGATAWGSNKPSDRSFIINVLQ